MFVGGILGLWLVAAQLHVQACAGAPQLLLLPVDRCWEGISCQQLCVSQLHLQCSSATCFAALVWYVCVCLLEQWAPW